MEKPVSHREFTASLRANLAAAAEESAKPISSNRLASKNRGIAFAARIPISTMTTTSSTTVNPDWLAQAEKTRPEGRAL
jgi:hypothetical protein